MSETRKQGRRIDLERLDDGRWRVFLDGEDLHYSYQFPWDALQSVLNGSLTGKPISGMQSMSVQCSEEPDTIRRDTILESDRRQKELLDRLRGLDGDGI